MQTTVNPLARVPKWSFASKKIRQNTQGVCQGSGEETQFIGNDITFYLEKEQETIMDDEAEEEKVRKEEDKDDKKPKVEDVGSDKEDDSGKVGNRKMNI